MLDIDIQGFRGQGAEAVCQILARAFARRGAPVQTFAMYGGEDRQAPVTASLRVGESPRRERGAGASARHLIVLDPALLSGAIVDGVDGVVLVNSPRSPCGRLAARAWIVAVDGDAIAEDLGEGAVAAAMAGAFGGATGLCPGEPLAAAAEDAGRRGRKREHAEAARRGYREAAEAVGLDVSLAS